VVRATKSAPSADTLAVLDAREVEILALLVDGLSTPQVARLFLSPKPSSTASPTSWALGVDDRAGAIALGRAAVLGGR
jgi:hypothetical protein